MLGKLISFFIGVTLSCPSFAAVEFDAAAVSAAFGGLGLECATYSPDRALLCKGSLDPTIYPLPLAIFIPPHYDPSGPAEIILHLHGYIDDDSTLDGTLAKYNFDQLLPQTKRNSILVVPSSVGKGVTFKAFLAPRKSFDVFLSAIEKLLAQVGLSPSLEAKALVLTSHSGGYHTVEAIVLHHPSLVKEVYLFDSLYNNGDDLLEFTRMAPAKKLYSVFIPLKDDLTHDWKWTARGNFLFWQKLYPREPDRNFIPSTLPPESPWAKIDSLLATKGVVFMRSDVSHEETLVKYFPKALRNQ